MKTRTMHFNKLFTAVAVFLLLHSAKGSVCDLGKSESSHGFRGLLEEIVNSKDVKIGPVSLSDSSLGSVAHFNLVLTFDDPNNPHGLFNVMWGKRHILGMNVVKLDACSPCDHNGNAYFVYTTNSYQEVKPTYGGWEPAENSPTPLDGIVAAAPVITCLTEEENFWFLSAL